MNTELKIVCSANMPFAEEAFSTLGNTELIPGSEICAEHVRDADILVTRSTTRIDASLLDSSPVTFVGTATIGTNHMDIDYLEERGIAWCSAPGCNANSVSEYVTAALLNLAAIQGIDLKDQAIGIIGVGNVGSLVALKAAALGMRVLKNDPPRARAAAAGEESGEHDFLSLDILLKESKFITFHVPLTKTGKHATFHMADFHFFAGLRQGTVLLNSSRGGVVDTNVLLKMLKRGRVSHAVIDTWEDEPAIPWELVEKASLATPHIAGYSFEGKVLGTQMVHNQLCEFLNTEPTWSHEPLMPPPLIREVLMDAKGRKDMDVLHDIVGHVYDIRDDDAAIRALGNFGAERRAEEFNKLRNTYRVRREFRSTKVFLSNASPELHDTVKDLGFEVNPHVDLYE